MFCPKCGSILLPKKEGSKKVFVCSQHGAVDNVEQKKMTDVMAKGKPDVEVVEKEIETLPKTDAECEKCGHKTAYFWTLQTRAGDEPETKFLKCEKCKHTWRDYN